MTCNPVRTLWLSLIISAGLIAVPGCGNNDASPGGTGDAAGTSAALPSALFVDTAPEGVQPVAALKASAAEGDEVVVRVVVGGGMDPIVEGLASAAIIDAGLSNHCLSEEDHCKTPWDYCCTPKDEITANRATLQVVDADGRVLAAELAQHIQPLSILTVRGIVGPRPNAGVLTINATAIHVGQVAK